MKTSRYLLYLAPMVVLPGVLYYFEQATYALWPDQQWVNESFHSTMEALGASAAVFMCVVLLQKIRVEENGKLFFVAMGFLSMGVLDGFHAIYSPGEPFVFLHSIAGLSGSIGFALIWLSSLNSYAFRKKWIPWAVGGAATLVGIWAISFPGTLPQMVNDEGFTRVAMVINVLSGALFLIATSYFLLDFFRTENLRSYLFASLALLFGVSGLIFAYSDLWDHSWWQWHFLRLLAYLLVLEFLFREYNLVQQELREVNQRFEQDATERMRAEEALQKSEERFRALSDAAHGGIIIHDQGIILECNSGLSDITGFSYRELIGSNGLNLIAPDSLDTVLANIKRGYDKSYEVQGVRKDGSLYPLAIKGKNTTYKNRDVRVIEFFDITEQKEAKNQLDKQRNLFERVLESIPTPVFYKDKELKFMGCNQAFLDYIGMDRDQIIGKNSHDLESSYLADMYDEADKELFKEGEKQVYETQIKFADGSYHDVMYYKSVFHYSPNEIGGLIGVILDISERKQAEVEYARLQKELQQAHKMDAVGQLTGGIAHDFNNILGIIIGNLDLLKGTITGDEKVHDRVATIRKSAQRAADLTKQLLSFSRKESSLLTIANINQTIKTMDSLIGRTITPEVTLELKLADGLWLVEVDTGGLENALLNLILNARDAMPNGGLLEIKSCNCTLDADYCEQNPGVTPGEYVQLIVSDSGEGISIQQQERIFEPFFTTKLQGKGTGLGLSMVFGFINSSKGHVSVSSELDIGTTFRLYFPRAKGKSESLTESVANSERLLRGNETILAVDDEEELLELAEDSLHSLGYRVLTARNGKQALDQLAENSDIALLFSDVVMPGGISGYDLAEQATATRPDLKVLLTSGYTGKATAHNNQMRFDANLLSKPYTQSELGQQLRLLLGESKLPTQSVAPFLQWSERFSTGIEPIDEDHQKLLGLLSRCKQVEEGQHGGANIKSILAELLAYTHTHFLREEAVMEVCNYPGLTSHRQVHRLLTRQVKKELSNFEKGKLDVLELLTFMSNWLVDHIQGMDHAIAPYCEGKAELIKATLEQMEPPS